MKQLILLLLLLPAAMHAQNTEMPAHYPQIQKTGDAQVDDANWRKAKDEWIKNYPAEYQTIVGTPPAAAPSPQIITEKQNQQPSAFEAVKTYKLVRVEAVPANGYKASASEINAETQSFQKDFLVNIEELQMDNNNQIRLFAANKKDLRASQSREGNNLSWLFVKEGCEKCTKTLFLSIEEESSTSLVYILKGEDENASFATKLYYSLSSN